MVAIQSVVITRASTSHKQLVTLLVDAIVCLQNTYAALALRLTCILCKHADNNSFWLLTVESP
jgi:hypothetical protein